MASDVVTIFLPSFQHLLVPFQVQRKITYFIFSADFQILQANLRKYWEIGHSLFNYESL